MGGVSDFVARLGVKTPIFLAPMAGEASKAGFVAAVSEAGGLGNLGGGYMAPDALQKVVEDIRQLTTAPFGINLFAPLPEITPDPEQIAAYGKALEPVHADLGLPLPSLPEHLAEDFDAQFEVVLAAGVPVFSYTFGLIGAERVNALKAAGTVVIGTATNVLEGLALQEEGVDAVIAQGAEAGGHRGTFIGGFTEGLIGTMALVPALVDALHIPVIAAGGIADRRGVKAAMALGASAVTVGTAFLSTEESPINPAYKEALLAPIGARVTRVTDAISGRPARGLFNPLMAVLELAEGGIPPYPLANAMTRSLRKSAGAQGRADYLSLWAGQAVTLNRQRTVAELMEELGQGLV